MSSGRTFLLGSELALSRRARSVGLVLASFSALLVPLRVDAATFYVAPTGRDTDAGTMALPFATMGQGQAAAAAGDTIYFRAGTYAYTAATAACGSSTATINGVLLDKSGTPGNRINYWAYPGETPIFDFSGIKDGCRITGIRTTGSWIHLKGLEVRGVPQNVDTNHESWGIWNSGSNNIFELINTHHNMGPGLFIQGGGNNLVLDCDSHENYDPLSSSGAGGNADGFGCHVGVGATGNVFRGCRAWWNSDDGWDLIESDEAVTIENSWSWYNGYLPGTMTASGNGNGFKAGGYGLIAANVPPNPPVHVVQKCLAFLNRAAGFYVNHHPVADHFYSNTSYGNHPDFNLLGVAADGVSNLNIALLRNNLALGGTLLANETGPSVDDAFNSWDMNLGVTVTAADFQSVSVTGMDGPRQADGSLPVVTNFHLAAGSDLIDKGTNVGLPYVGMAPDLGAFEYGAADGAGSTTATGTGGVSAGGAGGVTGTAGTTGAGGTAGVGVTGTGGTSGAAGAGPSTATGGAGVGGSAAPTLSAGACVCNTARSRGALFDSTLFSVLALAAWTRNRNTRRRAE
jgi:Pel9A-like, right handed beta helix region